jgi:hypothetical protein
VTATQDGYDWPSGCGDERWPAEKHQPAAPYFREQWQDDLVAMHARVVGYFDRLANVPPPLAAPGVIPPIPRYR